METTPSPARELSSLLCPDGLREQYQRFALAIQPVPPDDLISAGQCLYKLVDLSHVHSVTAQIVTRQAGLYASS